MTEVDEGKYIYDIVTVGERGQIVIPKEARKHFDINPGDKLIVAGDLKKGLAIVKAGAMKEFALKLLGVVGKENDDDAEKVTYKKAGSDT